MRTIKQKIIGAAVLFIAVVTAQSVFAYYNPSTGRFLSRDPIGEPGFESLQLAQGTFQGGRMVPLAQQASRWISRDSIKPGESNAYRYVLNNPVDFLDPDGRDTWIPYPYPGHWVSDPQPPPPPPPQYPDGFAMCRRDVAKDGKSDVVGALANCCGGEHTYMQYASTPQPPQMGPPFYWGWGFSGGVTTTPESHFNPSSCKTCTKNGDNLKYGSAAGKSSKSASDTDIMDCIKNRKPDHRYTYPTYVCSDWAKEAAKDCGLTCK